MSVRDSFRDPEYSNFTKECVRVGETLEGLGYELESENYSQGEQAFNFVKGNFTVCLLIEEK